MNSLDTVFSNGHWAKNVRTVGEMIAELQRLPPELPIHHGLTEDSADIVVFNRDNQPSPTHVSIDDGHSWDDEGWDAKPEMTEND